MSEDQVQNEQPGAEGRLRELGMQLKQSIEYKEWGALEQLLSIPSVWVIDRSMPVSEVVTTMRDLLGSAADIQLSLERVLQTDIGADRANASLVVRILWSEAETWAEHEELVDMHLGFKREGDDWAFSSLGFTKPNVPQAEQAAAQGGEVRSEFAADPQYLGAIADFMELMGGIKRGDWPPPTYLRPAPRPWPPSPYFAPPSAAAEGAAAPAPRPSHVIVYMPVFVPADLLAEQLPK